jgi:ATP-dependent RNA helicase DeaD
MTPIQFKDLSLSESLNQAIVDMGFEEASDIQGQAIPPLLAGRDLIGQAQTGTGKTCAFAIPIVERIDPLSKNVQALVLCPTRELAVQVAEEFRKLLKHKRFISVVAIYGGDPIQKQLRALQKRPQIIVGTPGRVIDHLGRKTLRLNAVQSVVLDEADEMLNMGFVDDIEKILAFTPKERQTIFFSATLPKAILDLKDRYQNNPVHIQVARQKRTTALIDASYYEIHRRKKMEMLVYLLEQHQFQLGLIFCNTKIQVEELVDRLQVKGYAAEGLHGGMPQRKRDQVMQRFRKGTVHFLIATDVAARGIDVSNIEAVFNYDLPLDQEFYIHRVGRTGRAGKSGMAITFVEKSQLPRLRNFLRCPEISLRRENLPLLAQQA